MSDAFRNGRFYSTDVELKTGLNELVLRGLWSSVMVI